MITDAYEALYQQARLPGLCALAPEQPLQYSK
ncbi:cyclohexadienyl dehydratase [Xanthomonas fragariae LMG 25863]|nr:cyclohexadienyl dehydratase [Xanthomonas fragariae LMG 25863]